MIAPYDLAKMDITQLNRVIVEAKPRAYADRITFITLILQNAFEPLMDDNYLKPRMANLTRQPHLQISRERISTTKVWKRPTTRL
jgi:hypothetical protein